MQVIEAAFKNETVGLVTREEFLNKRNTLHARQDEEAARSKRAAEAALQQVRSPLSYLLVDMPVCFQVGSLEFEVR